MLFKERENIKRRREEERTRGDYKSLDKNKIKISAGGLKYKVVESTRK